MTAVCAAVLTLASFGAGQPPSAGAAARVRFLVELRRAVAAGDRRAVSALVRFPLIVLVGGLQVPVADAAALGKLYDLVFTPDLQQAIAESGIPRRGEPPPRYPARLADDGMTIGAGFLWIEQVGDQYKLARVIVPPPGTIRRPGPAPTRVKVASGTTTQLSGMLARRNETQAYVVHAARGQSLRVTITGFRGTDVALHVLDAQGRVLPSTGAGGPRVWAGTVPASGDYRIDLVRAAPDTDPALLVVVSVTVR